MTIDQTEYILGKGVLADIADRLAVELPRQNKHHVAVADDAHFLEYRSESLSGGFLLLQSPAEGLFIEDFGIHQDFTESLSPLHFHLPN
jgi:hypothetical protein